MSTVIPDYIIQHTIGNQYIFADTDISNIEIDSNYLIGHSHQQFERQKEIIKFIIREVLDKTVSILIYLAISK